MDIHDDYRCLGDIDINEVSERILAQDDAAWAEQALRQQTYEVHQDTESIVLLFCDESWPEGEVYREPGWERLSDVVMPVVEQVIQQNYEPGGEIIRVMAARLREGGRITLHSDTLQSFHMGHRTHIPITTNDGVRFTVNGKPCPMEVGKVYEINNQRRHSVMNLGKEKRISLIFDYVPPSQMAASR